ncbi:MAG: DUF1735 domain-containing protein [Candidatus Cryptobacteroides sp.]
MEILNIKRVVRIAGAVSALLVATSCYEDYIGDYDYPNMGFALPRQVRTVMSKTNTIYVGVSIGGLREVDMDAWAQFTFDQSLLKGLPYTILPEHYYQLSDPTTFRVRKSNLMVADVAITFTEDFYADPAALSKTYALPFRLVAASISGPDANGNVGKYGSIREGAETAVIVIKYSSSYSGTYYRLGEVVEVNEEGTPVGDPVIYKGSELMKNATVNLESAGPSTLTFQGYANGLTAGTVTLDVDPEKCLDEDADVTLTLSDGLVTGSAKWVRKGRYNFYNGDNPAPQFELDYTYQSEGRYYHVNELLVLRKWAEEELRVETF